MEFLRLVLLFVHLVAMAGLIGALLAQVQSGVREVTSVIVNSARVAFVAGLLLVGVLEGTDGVDVDHAKVGVKLVIGLVVVGLLESNRKKASFADAMYYAALGLSVLNVAVAVFWSSVHA